jgi:hypothetical protein
VYALSTVSYPLPNVSTVIVPVLAEVNSYQTLAEFCVCGSVHEETGSSGAVVASVVSSVAVKGAATMTAAAAHASFEGASATASANFSVPLSMSSLPVASRRYVVPALTKKLACSPAVLLLASLQAISVRAAQVPV